MINVGPTFGPKMPRWLLVDHRDSIVEFMGRDPQRHTPEPLPPQVEPQQKRGFFMRMIGFK